MLYGAQDRRKDAGLLIMRLGIAGALLWLAVPKLIGGVAAWQSVGTPLAFVNLGLPDGFMGLLVLSLETLCALSFVFGPLFRLAGGLLFLLFLLFGFNYFNIAYKSMMLWSLALTAVFLGLVLTGPGRYVVAGRPKKR